MGFINNLRDKFEMYKIEQKYTRRSKRTTFVSGAQYVNGEYVYTGNQSITLKGGDASRQAWMEEKREPVVRVKQIFKRQSTMF